MKTEIIVSSIVFVIWTSLAFIAGDYLDWIEKEPKPIIPRDSAVTETTKPLSPQTAHLETSKPGKPIASDSGLWDVSGDSIDNPNFKPVIGGDSIKIYSEIIDSTVIFNKDSLDFVAEITFNERTKSFDNTFDFSLRLNKLIREVVRYVEVPAELEVYQNGFVIVLGLLTAFLFGLVL